jgi:hypothetical protein
VHKTPIVLGSEDAHKWKLLLAKQDKSIDRDLIGSSVMDSFFMAKFEKEIQGKENPEQHSEQAMVELL